ncbi:conserved protein of unknown function (plasmid) [Carnobacterium divergens]|nr:conserved protein of unknown function [Carnobacterium divergens]
MLGWDVDFLLKSTPNLWLKSYIHWLNANTDFNDKQPETMSISQSPFW